MRRILALLLPALFPSWRFFQDVGPRPLIEVRCDGGPWQEVMAIPASEGPFTPLRRLIWSPSENERLFLISLADRLLTDPTDAIRDHLTRRIAAQLDPATVGQFRLSLVGAQDQSTAYISAPFTVAAVLR